MNPPQHPLLHPSGPISAWKHAGSSSGCFVFLQHHARCCQLTNETASPPQTSPLSPALGTQHMSPGTTQGCSAQAGIIRQGFIGRGVGTATMHNPGQGGRLCPHQPHGKLPPGIPRLLIALRNQPRTLGTTWPHHKTGWMWMAPPRTNEARISAGLSQPSPDPHWFGVATRHISGSIQGFQSFHQEEKQQLSILLHYSSISQRLLLNQAVHKRHSLS